MRHGILKGGGTAGKRHGEAEGLQEGEGPRFDGGR